MLLLMVLFSLCPLRVAAQLDGGRAYLKVCNHGSIEVDVATAVSDIDLAFRKNWIVKGWTNIPPGDCKGPYSDSVHGVAYIAFRFASGHAAKVEITARAGGSADYGKNYWGKPVLSRADKNFCMPSDKFAYRTYDADPGGGCNLLEVSGAGRGQYFAFQTALYFQPDGQQCYDVPQVVRIESGSCAGGEYGLTITPTETDHVIVVQPGVDSSDNRGSDNSASENVKQFVDLLKSAAKAANEQQKQNDETEKKAAAQREAHYQKENRQRWAGSHQSPASYDPQWVGQNMVVTGTVSRVEVTAGRPPWVIIYFKESPDATFVVCSPYPDMFQDRVGPNLSTLVGKTLQAAGEVEGPYCGHNTKGSIKVVVSSQWQVQ
jgi:uncharacterized membrane protein